MTFRDSDGRCDVVAMVLDARAHAFVVCWLCAAAWSVQAKEPTPQSVASMELFRAGERGYRTYRIPALCLTSQGTLLAGVAARFNGHGDWSDTDIQIRRSVDGGKTWSDAEVVADDGHNTVDNPTFIVDPARKLVHLMYQINYERAYVKTSRDDGTSWSAPHEITRAFTTFRKRDGYEWKVLAMGPGHGIVLGSGRLVVPIWLATSPKHRPSIAATVYSDDHGKTWRAGEIVASCTGDVVNPSEHALVELTDGGVMTNMRTESAAFRRLVSVSSNGADHWTAPLFDDELVEPICMGSIVRIPAAAVENAGALVFCNPDSTEPRNAKQPQGPRVRQNLTLRMSADDGATWPKKLTLEAGQAGYSDLAAGNDGTVYALYESGAVDDRGALIPRAIAFAAIPSRAIAASPSPTARSDKPSPLSALPSRRSPPE